MDTSGGNMTKYAWTVGNLKESDYLWNWSFALKNDPDIRFCLYIASDKDNLFRSSIGLYLLGLGGKSGIDVELDVNFWFEASDGRKSEIKRRCHTFKTQGDKCAFGIESNSEASVFNEAYNSGNPILTLHCELTPVPKISTQKNLSHMLWTAYEEGVGHDMTIQVADKEYKVSSLILVSQSEVFKSMLSSDKFKDDLTKKIGIENTAVPVMDAFIRYLYLGEVQSEEEIEGLFELSDKYMVKELKNLCGETMLKSLTETNAAQRLVLAIIYNDNDLKECVLESISKMGTVAMEKIFQSNEWFNYLKTIEPSD